MSRTDGTTAQPIDYAMMLASQDAGSMLFFTGVTGLGLVNTMVDPSSRSDDYAAQYDQLMKIAKLTARK